MREAPEALRARNEITGSQWLNHRGLRVSHSHDADGQRAVYQVDNHFAASFRRLLTAETDTNTVGRVESNLTACRLSSCHSLSGRGIR